MADEQEIDTVVEDRDEDSSQAVDFAKVTPTPETKAQSKAPESPVPIVVDEEATIKKDVTPSVDATQDGQSADVVVEKKTEQEPVKKLKYRQKDENRIPEYRFKQVVRQRKIAETQARSLQQKHLELLDSLERFQATNPNAPLPKPLLDAVQANKQELQEMRVKQHEARLDEADEWYKAEKQKYVDAGFKFPDGLERELIVIIQAENLNTLDPLDAYQKAFTMWLEENVVNEELEPTKAETSNVSNQDKTESGKPVTQNPTTIREEQKKKAAGVPKAKTPSSVPKQKDQKWSGHHYYAVDEDPRF